MRRTLYAITAVIGLALLLLLAYSVERSSWLLGMYETAGEGSNGPALAMAAALVAELAAIALIVGEGAIGLLNQATARRLARWANLGLALVLSLQAVAGLIAGYTRGSGRMLAELGSGSADARFAVASVALLLGNLTAPGLILALSKIAALLVQALVSLPSAQQLEGRPVEVEPAQQGRLVPVLAHAATETGAEYATVHVQTNGARAQSCQSTSAEPARDRTCKYCGTAGLSAIEVARHGRARARAGICPV